MTVGIEESAARLLIRLETELRREGPSTATVGGITKAGNDLEELLKRSAAHVLRASGRSLAEVLSEKRLARGAGTYAKILDGERPQPEHGKIANAIIREIGQRRSTIQAFIREVRNANNHPGSGPKNTSPLCQRRVRQPPLDISVPKGGEWCHRRAQVIPDPWS